MRSMQKPLTCEPSFASQEILLTLTTVRVPYVGSALRPPIQTDSHAYL